MPMTKADAERVALLFLTDYPGALALAYKFRDNTVQLYGSRAGEVPQNMKGGYLPKETIAPNGHVYRGRVDVPLENIEDARDLLMTLRHEVLGHYGTNTFAPAEKRALLDGVIAGCEEPTLKLLWDDINARYAGTSLDMRAEEVIALQSEGIEPRHHVGNNQVPQQGQQSFKETCIARIRPMGTDDLHNIVCMVAQGLHDRTRTQQTFPEINELFRKDNTMEPKKPFHEVVAEKLIEQLKAGTAPWQKPWQPGEPNSLMPMNPTTGKRYRGINAIHLMAQGRNDSRWMTYKQAAAASAQVRKGEKGTPVQYWKFSEEQDKLDDQGRPVRNANGEKIKETVRLERPRVFFATVFNGEQIDGLPPQQIQPKAEHQWDVVERAEHILQASGAKITHAAGDRAFYRPTTDSITLPEKNQFESADRYYATALHELGHWTGHPSRLDRDLAHPFGSEGYAKEELRAEISSMIVGDELGIGHDPEQHAAYVGSWIKALQDEPLEIFRAASDAEKICNYLLNFEQIQEKELTMQPIKTNQNEEQMDRDLNSIDETVAVTQMQKNTKRHYINVPFKEKDEAKSLGARWDYQQRSWFVPPGVDITRFVKWSQEVQKKQNNSNHKQYLAVPYGEHGAAKAAGARWDKVAKSWYIGPNGDMQLLGRWRLENVQSQQEPAINPREEFAEAMKLLGCIISHDHPIMDGKKHRIQVEGDKKSAKSGFYVGYLDGHPAGYIANNRTGVDLKWKSKGYVLDPAEKAKLQAEAAEKLIARAAALQQTHEDAAERVRQQMTNLIPVTQQTPYMQSKGIQPVLGIFTDADGKKTYIPAYDEKGKQWTMQYIQEDGTKRFAKDSRKEGCFHIVGGDFDSLAAAPALVLQEGYATAATNANALGFATVSAFDAGNLLSVAKVLHKTFPNKPVVIFGDDDRHQELTHGTNPGKKKAQEAAQAVGGKAVFPIFAPREVEYPTDMLLITPQRYREHLRALTSLETAPVERTAELKQSLLSKEQIAALERMKKYTDFNDLAIKSILGQEGVARQVIATVDKVVKEAERKQKHTKQQTHQKKRSNHM